MGVGVRLRLAWVVGEEAVVVGLKVLRPALEGAVVVEEHLEQRGFHHHHSSPALAELLLLVLGQAAEVVELQGCLEQESTIWNRPLHSAGVEGPLFRRGCLPVVWRYHHQVYHLHRRKSYHQTRLRTSHLLPGVHVISALRWVRERE